MPPAVGSVGHNHETTRKFPDTSYLSSPALPTVCKLLEVRSLYLPSSLKPLPLPRLSHPKQSCLYTLRSFHIPLFGLENTRTNPYPRNHCDAAVGINTLSYKPFSLSQECLEKTTMSWQACLQGPRKPPHLDGAPVVCVLGSQRGGGGRVLSCTTSCSSGTRPDLHLGVRTRGRANEKTGGRTSGL